MRALALLALLVGCTGADVVDAHQRAEDARRALHGFGAASASVYLVASMACQHAPSLPPESERACGELEPAYEQLRAVLTAGLATVDDFEAGEVALVDLDLAIFAIAERVAVLQVRWKEVADGIRVWLDHLPADMPASQVPRGGAPAQDPCPVGEGEDPAAAGGAATDAGAP